MVSKGVIYAMEKLYKKNKRQFSHSFDFGDCYKFSSRIGNSSQQFAELKTDVGQAQTIRIL